MIEIFIITFVLMILAISIMAIGYIVQKKNIKGSCGGIADLGMEKVCDCDEPCDKRKELLKRQAEEKRLEQANSQHAIDVKTIL